MERKSPDAARDGAEGSQPGANPNSPVLGEVERARKQIEAAMIRLQPLTKQGEDYIWRPAQHAIEVLGGLLAEPTVLAALLSFPRGEMESFLKWESCGKCNDRWRCFKHGKGCGAGAAALPAQHTAPAASDDEPTEEMLIAGCKALNGQDDELIAAQLFGGKHGVARTKMRLRWKAMVRERQHPGTTVPVPMVLFCPACHTQHVDAPDPTIDWANPPHRSHKCHYCKCVWRPADVLTTGVGAIATRGKVDTWLGASSAATPEQETVSDERDVAVAERSAARSEQEK